MDALETLHIEHIYWESLPTEIGELRGLQSLVLNNVGSKEKEHDVFPICVDFSVVTKRLSSRLKSLTLRGYKFDDLPLEIQDLEALETLKLVDIRALKTLPLWLDQLPNLKHVYLQECHSLTVLASELLAIEHLETVEVHPSCRSFLGFPDSFPRAKRGRYYRDNIMTMAMIDLSYFNLNYLPKIFDKHPNIAGLNLSGNKHFDWKEEIKQLVDVQEVAMELDLSNNGFNDNDLASIMPYLPRFSKLNLSHNNITQLPYPFFEKKHKGNLNLSANLGLDIEHLVENFGDCINVLYLEQLNLKRLPKVLKKLNVEKLYLNGNPDLEVDDVYDLINNLDISTEVCVYGVPKKGHKFLDADSHKTFSIPPIHNIDQSYKFIELVSRFKHITNLNFDAFYGNLHQHDFRHLKYLTTRRILSLGQFEGLFMNEQLDLELLSFDNVVFSTRTII